MDARRQAYLDAMGIRVWVRRESAPESEALAVRGAVEASPVAPPSEPPPLVMPADESRAQPSSAEAAPELADEDWDGLAARVAACEQCSELVAHRSQTVFGGGNRQAELLVIGAAPGADEDRQGESFVGSAGQLLDSMLRAIGVPRTAVYTANLLKCRLPDDRAPKPDEAFACRGFLLRQIALIEPKVILVMGRSAAQTLLESEQPMDHLRGTLHHDRHTGIPVVVTYHPADLLHSPAEKRKVWGDLRLALQTCRTNS